jgi:hypothetical protein
MIITIVSEMSKSKFQWSDAWNIDNQIKYNCIVVPFEFSKRDYLNIPKNDKHWNIIRKADLVLVYCTRINAPTDQWRWWELPRYVKQFMRPEAKMICQTDEDWISLFHNDWTWWEDNPFNNAIPESFFKETGILDIPDLWLTVLKKPEFAQYTKKSIKYVPLPQLNKYEKESSESNSEYMIKGIDNLHGNSIGIMRHSSRKGSIKHTIKNVFDKIDNLPIVYFSTEYSGITPIDSVNNIKCYTYLNKTEYMRILRHDCKISIDDSENYIGWSRFVMESAIEFVPCISSNYCGKVLFPELYVKHKDYIKQISLIKKLTTDHDFYIKMVEEGHKNLSVLTNDAFCNTIMNISKEIDVKSTEINVAKELFLATLAKFVPFEKIPQRPQEINGRVWDRVHQINLTQSTWDEHYSKFVEFMSNESEYDKYFKEAMDRKEKHIMFSEGV